MLKKIIIIGGVAGGASVAARARRLDQDSEIIIFERGEHVSFSNCCLPYHLSGIVANSDSLVMMTPEDFKTKHDIDVRTCTEVVSINRKEQTVCVQNKKTGQNYTENYDKLILSPGAFPLKPKSISGVEQEHVFTVRNVTDISRLKTYIDQKNILDIVVIGGGFIGVEVVENLRKNGKNVTLIEGLGQIMTPFDYDMVQILHKEMIDHGVHIILSSTVTAIESNSVVAIKEGCEVNIAAQVVVLAIGVRPEIKLALDSGLCIGDTGGIWVDHNYQTSDSNIYAVGDAIETYDRLSHRSGRLALAGPAQRQARAVADHIYGISCTNKGFIGSSCVRIFDQNAACTGLSEKSAKKAGIPCNFVYILPPDKPGLMPNSHYMCFKLIFEIPTGRILGAQAIGRGSVDKRVDIIATIIAMGGTLEDVKELELCYSPVFGTAKDVVNMAGLVGLNILNGIYRQVPVSQVRSLVENGAYIVDVREEKEFQAGHLKCAHNIPLSQLRQRMDEIPKEVPVYLHCRTSQRSYYALMYMKGNGYTNLYNISGSYLGICLYEYYNDQSSNREPILTRYNFE